MDRFQPISGDMSSENNINRMNNEEPLSNVLYDLVTVMSNCGQAAEALGEYIDDAKQANDSIVANVFEQIRQDEIKHCEQTRNILDQLVKQGKL